MQCHRVAQKARDTIFQLLFDKYRENIMQKDIRYLCERTSGKTFVSPDKKWLIHIEYETEQKETILRDAYGRGHTDHYIRTIDKIHSVSMEKML